MFESDVLIHTPDGEGKGVEEGPKASVKMFRGAFPDLNFSIRELIAENDKVVALFEAKGTHKGDFLDISPTGKSVEFDGIYIYRLINGKIAEVWIYSDISDLINQLKN